MALAVLHWWGLDAAGDRQLLALLSDLGLVSAGVAPDSSCQLHNNIRAAIPGQPALALSQVRPSSLLQILTAPMP